MKRAEEQKDKTAKRVTPEDIRLAVTSYFCLPRLFIFPENHELLKAHDFQLPLEEVARMQFLQYYKPSVGILYQAFSHTYGIQLRGQYLYFNEAREFSREGFHLEAYALLFGPFPKKISAFKLQRIVREGGKKPVMYSICIEKQANCFLFAIYANNCIMKTVRALKEVHPIEFARSDKFEQASRRMRYLLRADQQITGKDAGLAWNELFCFDCDEEIAAQALKAIKRGY